MTNEACQAQRHDTRVSILGAAAAAVLLQAVVAGLPLAGNADHALTHLALGLPLVLLLVLLARRRPAYAAVPAGSLAWRLCLAGLALLGVVQIVEAVGAFGYDDSDNPTDSLAELHNAAVLVGPLGVVSVIVGVVNSLGVALALRAGAGGSRYVTGGVVLAALLAIAFVVGGLIFGY